MDSITEDLGEVADERAGQITSTLVNDGGLDLIDGRGAASRYLDIAHQVCLEGIRLPATERPHICSANTTIFQRSN